MSRRLSRSTASRAVVLIRLWVGAVFLSEGLQEFLLPDQLGAGRFFKRGLPMPELLGPLVGTFEIVCGSLVMLGFQTRIAVLPPSRAHRVWKDPGADLCRTGVVRTPARRAPSVERTRWRGADRPRASRHPALRRAAAGW
jgi:hypothetical protein